MSKIKLVYFDFNFWRIDILRLSLAYAGIDYEFERIPREDWIRFKDKQPFGQLPVMYYKENVYCHTHSLATFCASKSDLYSSDEKKQIISNIVPRRPFQASVLSSQEDLGFLSYRSELRLLACC